MAQSISLGAPLRQAITTVKSILFAPFDLLKWMGLGFTAWLATLHHGRPIFNLSSLYQQAASRSFTAAWDWVLKQGMLGGGLLIGGGILILALSLALTWISSRAQFMFLDNVIHNRAEIVKPWQRYRASGNSYFLFSICLGLIALLILGAIILMATLIALPDIMGYHCGPKAICALILGGGLGLIGALGLVSILIFLKDFIVPLMLLRACPILAAWSHFKSIFKKRPGIFMLYLLLRLGLAWAVDIIALLCCCCLCCLMWIPYISTLILLPLLVFLRCYALHFLAQFGDEYQLLPGAVNMTRQPAMPATGITPPPNPEV